MTKAEFDEMIRRDGKDIMRFCYMETGNSILGDELYNDLTLTCEVTYKDGSKESVEVEIGNQIMTMKEAGLTNYYTTLNSQEGKIANFYTSVKSEKETGGTGYSEDDKGVFITYKMRG